MKFGRRWFHPEAEALYQELMDQAKVFMTPPVKPYWTPHRHAVWRAEAEIAVRPIVDQAVRLMNNFSTPYIVVEVENETPVS